MSFRQVFAIVSGAMLLALATALAAGPASAADIKVVRDGDGPAAITVEGTIDQGDDRRFADLALGVDNAVVVFESPGGNLVSGLEIGRAIRLKRFVTWVPDNTNCASACALAWLGGTRRLMADTARVGFHAAYDESSGQKVPTGVGNALVGAYLMQLGVTERGIVFFTEAPPTGIQWLTFAEAQKLGIDVVRYNAGQEARPATPAPAMAPAATPLAPSAPLPAVAPPVSPSPVPSPGWPEQQLSAPLVRSDWSMFGDWIQVFSRPTMSEAVQLATQMSGQLTNVHVFRYTNGWYAGVLGPYPAGAGLAMRDHLLEQGAIPPDSLLARAERMAELVYGKMPAPAAAGRATPPGVGSTLSRMETAAVAFYDAFQTAWSAEDETALAFFGRVYGNSVLYHGRQLSLGLLLQQK